MWVSEVLLQQTRVEVAVRYYRAFLRAFPDVRTLATAREEDVLRVWAGLGYYARARNLLRAAREVVRRGGFPTTAAAWRRLPGVGPYTAAAVASIAFGEDAVALDGNVLRVGLRLLGLRRPSRHPASRRAVERALRAALPPGRAGEFNQALMDLGATVCVPRNPRCPACPVRAFCRARALGRVGEIPVRTPQVDKPHRRFVAVLVQDPRGRVLLVRRPPGGLWGGLWTLPYVEAGSWQAARPALEKLLGVQLRRGSGRWRMEHAFTHFRATFEVCAARTTGRPRGARFVARPGSEVPTPAPFRDVLARLASAPS